MGSYAKADARRRETIEWARRARIADRIEALGAARMEGMALWLFCPVCGYRKVAGFEWFMRRARDVEAPMGDFTSKLYCVCRMRGVTVPVMSPLSIHDLRVNRFTREGRALLLSDDG